MRDTKIFVIMLQCIRYKSLSRKGLNCLDCIARLVFFSTESQPTYFYHYTTVFTFLGREFAGKNLRLFYERSVYAA